MVVKGRVAFASPRLFSLGICRDSLLVECFVVGEENISESINANVVLPDEVHPEIATVSALGVF